MPLRPYESSKSGCLAADSFVRLKFTRPFLEFKDRGGGSHHVKQGLKAITSSGRAERRCETPFGCEYSEECDVSDMLSACSASD